TGFVGTGGGMMMLVVFTAFLGMELKTAVGTSTFIMTFTALIASVSHILIHPAILLEKWDVMLLCITVATAASLISARFANRVSNRTVGLATGIVLTLLGGSMLLLHFWPQLSAFPLFLQTIRCLGRLILYIIPCVLILLPIRLLTRVPSFVFRKLLHIIAFSCFVVMLLAAESWQAASLTCVIIAVLLYPLLSMFEDRKWYSRLLVEKSPGEIKRSLLMLFFMFAAVIAVAWGVFGNVVAAAASILMWGEGDAVAALVGIPFGRHKIMFRPVSGRKSWEGSCSMLVVAFLTGFGLLWLYFGYPPAQAAGAAAVGAFLGTVVELLSPSEWDTVTVPVAILAVMLLML
ncbi:MAG: TSUP family transporter, partial [Clostridia bacterium]|nr:TSUP family transporter [Clostridia bacterium]